MELGFAALLDSIGTPSFDDVLAALLHEQFGARAFKTGRLEAGRLATLASSTRSCAADGSVSCATEVLEQCARTGLLQHTLSAVYEPSTVSVHRVRNGPDEVEVAVLGGLRCSGRVGLLMVFDAGALKSELLDTLRRIGELLLAVVSKHVPAAQHRSPDRALSSLEGIQSCLDGLPGLTRRESEVAARILYGMTTTGIALDLGIGEESVRTYRKRAYGKLTLGTERELLNWYLRAWVRCDDIRSASARASASAPQM